MVLAVLASTGANCAFTAPLPPSTEPGSLASTITPASPAVLEGIPVGFTAEGYPYRGAAEAPVILVEYSDYLTHPSELCDYWCNVIESQVRAIGESRNCP